MTKEETPARVHLQTALEHLGEFCDPLAGMQLKELQVGLTAGEDELLAARTSPRGLIKSENPRAEA